MSERMTVERLIEVYGEVRRYTVTIVVPVLREDTPPDDDRDLIQSTLDDGAWDFLIESIIPATVASPDAGRLGP